MNLFLRRTHSVDVTGRWGIWDGAGGVPRPNGAPGKDEMEEFAQRDFGAGGVFRRFLFGYVMMEDVDLLRALTHTSPLHRCTVCKRKIKSPVLYQLCVT